MTEGPDGLDELAAVRLTEGRAILAQLVRERDVLLAAAITERDERMHARRRWVEAEAPAMRALDDWDDAVQERFACMAAEQRRCLLFALAERLAAGGEQYSEPAHWLTELCRMLPDLVVGDVRLLAMLAEPGAGSGGSRPFEVVVRSVGALLAERAPGAEPLAVAVAEQVCRWNVMTYHWYGADTVLRATPEELREWGAGSQVVRLRDKALELAGLPPALPAFEGAVSRDDGWGLAAIGWLGVMEDWPTHVKLLLDHCATARTPRPRPKWEKTCRQLLDAMADPDRLLLRLLDLLVSTEPVAYLTDSGRLGLLVGFNEQLIKGIVWAAGLLDPPWLPEVLRAVAERCLRMCRGHVFGNTAVQGEKIPYACFRALAASGSHESLAALARIGQATSNGAVLKNLAKTLEEAAARRGMSAASLLDRLTPDHGLDSDGQVSIETDAGTWVIRLQDREGAVADGPADADIPAQVSETLAEIKATASGVRTRLEALFAERREWHADDFADCYLRHRLTGWLATRLAWTFTPTDGGLTIRGFPDADSGDVRTPQGRVRMPPGCLVQLVQPVHLPVGELAELRQLCEDLEIAQPVRQLWRETYRTTADERNDLYTERYAGHVLRFGQAYGLARRRGWVGGFLSGAWDGGDTANAHRDYPAAGLRASWAIAQFDDMSREIAVDLCLTERVWFSPLGDADMAPIPLADVPAEVFSEAMRDLDLVVSVTTVATDPLWLEHYRGWPAIDQYWERITRGGLDQLRVNRRDILARFCDGPETSQRYQLTDRELVVTGSLGTYRIDLATANVQTDPGGKWLSFDTRTAPDKAYRHDILGLPAIDDDEILQRILVRAAILADDEQLASRKLLKQIRG
jgi:Domain of unknown function (DUF4132)